MDGIHTHTHTNANANTHTVELHKCTVMILWMFGDIARVTCLSVMNEKKLKIYPTSCIFTSCINFNFS